MTNENSSDLVKEPSDLGVIPSVIRLEEGYKPKTASEGEGTKGFKPKPTGKPEGVNPPSGGSNVNPPPAPASEKKKEA